jgi:hypothetical protein
MSGTVSIFLRGDEIFVIPQGGGGGVYYDIEPISVVPPAADELGRAVTSALDISTGAPSAPLPDLRSRRSPVLARARVRSFKDFYSNAAHALVYRDGGGLWLLPFRPAADGRGFEPFGDAVAITDGAELGAQVLSEILKLPRATGSIR